MGNPDWATAATTGILTTILNQGVSWFRDWRRDKKQSKTQADYLALQLCVILESFVSSCVYRSWHDSVDARESRDLGYKLPKLTVYPDDSSDWKALYLECPNLTGQVMSFPNEITSAEQSCEFQGMREGNHYASMDETIAAGMKAWKLAKSLRKHFDLESVTISHFDSLERDYKKLQERTEFNAAFAHYAGLSEV